MAEALKHSIYSKQYVEDLASQLASTHNSIESESFLGFVCDDLWEARELKDRMRQISLGMQAYLPKDYEKACEILFEIADMKRSSKHQNFADICFPDYIELCGVDHFDISMHALHYLTRFSSAEFAIRPFIVKYEDKTMERMQTWAEDENVHVRRLASEGCRPRLPWAMALPAFKKDPAPILPILEQLKTDEEDYVRRSVANNLNDIAKDNPEIVLETGKRWIGSHTHTDWIVKHASRTLLKQGHPKALALFGFAEEPEIKLEALRLSHTERKIGESLSLEAELVVLGDQEQKLRIEYAVYFVKANGSLSKKVFQLREGEFSPGAYPLSKQHSFEQRSTRKHYPGEHKITLIINGKERLSQSFLLKA